MSEQPTVGASQIAALMGCHTAGLTAHQLWRSLVHGEKQDQNAAMSRGVKFELALAALYAREAGLSLVLPMDQQVPPDSLHRVLLVQPMPPEPQHTYTVKHLHATPDAFRFPAGDEGRGLLVEFKTSESYQGWGEPGTTQVPSGYLMQVQAQMACSGIQEADLCVLLPHFDFRVYRLTAMPELQDRLQEVAKQFLEEYVLPKKMPLVDDSEACRQNLLDLFPEPKDDYLEAKNIPGIHEVLAEWQADQAALKELESRMDFRKNKLREIIGDHQGIQSDLGRVDNKKPKPTEVVDYKLVAQDLAMHLAHYEPAGEYDILVKRHTSFKENARRLAAYWKKA